MIWSTRKLFRREPRELLQSGSYGIQEYQSSSVSRKWHKWVGLGFFVASFCLAWLVGLNSPEASMSFFGAGGMLLIGGLFLFRARLGKAGGEENVITKIPQLERRKELKKRSKQLIFLNSSQNIFNFFL